ncbi:MAG: DUF4919 domain-containing protein [Proteiniphilum sp.]|nr:DUF4919 domain-containing protein [Proteiniphilum sp.]
MRHILVFILLTVAFCDLYPQVPIAQAPDYESIKQEIFDSSSDYYYPQLMERYEAFDSTLTVTDFRHLYYGFIFHENYDPDWKSRDEKKIEKYFRNAKEDERNFDKVVDLVCKSLQDYPFDLRTMRFLCFLYHQKGDKEMGEKASHRFISIIGAILSSGDGESCETAYHVISPRHEFSILKIFQFESAAQMRVDGCNYLELKENKRGMEGIYFKVPGIEK